MQRVRAPLHQQDGSWSWHDDAGLEMVEYALIAAVLLGGLILIVPQFTDSFTQAYVALINALSAAMSN